MELGDLPVPYKSQVTDKVQAGKCLEIKGGFKLTFITPDFCVNLLSKAETLDPPVDPTTEVILQFRVETTRSVFPPVLKTEIVVNTFQNSKWGKEARYPDPFGLAPLSPKILDMAICFAQDHFEFFANNEKFGEYKYVIPVDHIDHIEITGDVTLQQVNWKNKELTKESEEADFYHPVGYPMFLAGKKQKRCKKGRVRKYFGKLSERCVPCCK
uniref:Galectin n=1 Tax=Acrobeloides nanus TaxID=290746 RepID=A0A914DV18_9BILA